MRGSRPAFTLETFLAKNVTTDALGCWVVSTRSTHHGYKQVSIKGRRHSAHRWVYTQATGREIPAGMELDHLCRNTSCVNPAHLEAVTHAENNRRKRTPHCKRGHARTPENTYGNRNCKPCSLLRSAIRWRQEKANRELEESW